MLSSLQPQLSPAEQTAFHHAIARGVRATGHLADGEWQVHGPLGAPTDAHVNCAYCGETLRILLETKGPRLVMPRAHCRGPVAGRWR